MAWRGAANFIKDNFVHDHEFDKPNHLLSILLAEFVGTFILIFVGAGTAAHGQSGVTGTALAFGSVVFILVYTLGPPGHFNPAITVGQLFSPVLQGKHPPSVQDRDRCRLLMKISFVRAVLYVLAQMAGAVLAALFLGIAFGATPGFGYGTTVPTVGVGRALVLEMFGTFCLVLTVHAATAQTSALTNHALPPLAIGFVVLAMLLLLIPLTGGSINPARSFGASLASSIFGTPIWTDHWVYWVGPLTGAIVASFVWAALRALLLSPDPARQLPYTIAKNGNQPAQNYPAA